MAKDRLADWDSTAANNTDVGGINIDEGWPPESVNNAMREKMAQIADFFKDKTGTITSTGAGNTYAITSNDGVAAYAAGQLYAFIANHANTGAATLNVNAIGAKSLVKNHDLALASGDIEANQICIVAYGATDDTFQLLTQLAQVTAAGANVDIAGTTAETDIDKAADSILVYDDSASANREAVLSDVLDTTDAGAQATTSGTEVDFLSLPAWAKVHEIVLNEVSLSGTDEIYIQLGDAGGIETTGYTSTCHRFATAAVATSSTAAFHIDRTSAGDASSGTITIRNISGNIWVASGAGKNTTAQSFILNGVKTLTGALTQLRITRSGTDTLDGGSGTVFSR